MINKFSFKHISRKPVGIVDFNINNKPKYMAGTYIDQKFICELTPTGYKCISKYSGGNLTNMDFILDNIKKYGVKFANDIKVFTSRQLKFENVEEVLYVDFAFETKPDGTKYVNLGYGINPHYINCTAKDPGMPVEKYRLHKAISPSNKTFTHIKSGRVFTTGNSRSDEGMYYTCDLMENGVKVAEIYTETYYKD